MSAGTRDKGKERKSLIPEKPPQFGGREHCQEGKRFVVALSHSEPKKDQGRENRMRKSTTVGKNETRKIGKEGSEGRKGVTTGGKKEISIVR